MEGEEMEMSKEELQRWIRGKIEKDALMSSDVLEKYNLLKSLLEKSEKHAANLLKLCESVADSEEMAKKLYSVLGLEYSDMESSDDDDKPTDCGRASLLPCEPGHSEASNSPAPLLSPDSVKLERDDETNCPPILTKELVVVLTRLLPSEIAGPPCSAQNHCSKNEYLSSAESDVQWEPGDESSDSDFSISNFNIGPNKRRKMKHKNEKCKKSHTTPQATTGFDAKSNDSKMSVPMASTNSSGKSSVTNTSTPQASANTVAQSNTTKPPQANTNDNAKSNSITTSKSSASTNGTSASDIKSAVSSSAQTTKTPASEPPEEVSVNMNVLARRRALNWQRGKVVEILTRAAPRLEKSKELVQKEDGRLKYKIHFEKKGKSLVSGHHIAFEHMPKVDQLVVGARVVVRSENDETQFLPGILAEIPSRRNRMRFLVFIDDHTPLYVGLPVLHLVCRPLADPLGDIPDETHMTFMREYLDFWPHPPQTQYKVGQTANVDYDGVQQKCDVVGLDCSLMQVVFQSNQHKEWIYRGSIRLEHMVNMRRHLEAKKGKMKNCQATSVMEPSKSGQ